MRAVLLLVAVTGCTTHHRLTAGPTYVARKPDVRAPQPGDPKTSPPSDFGADAAGEVTGGGDHFRLLLAAGARVGNGVTGGGFRFGATLGTEPRPLAVRGTFSLGPTFVTDGTRLDVRAGFGVDYGLITGEDPYNTGDKRTTIGAELFVSSIGSGDDHRLMIGIGVSVGSFDHGSLGIAASPPASD